MAEGFDPYHKWLGISPKDQPPNHYRLLAIELFESDPDVIEGAADQRMAHVRTFQTGQNSALSQRILNELSAAKLCLLAPEQKADYDRQLQAKLLSATSAAAPVAAKPQPAPPPMPIPAPAPVVVAARAPASVLSKRAKPSKPGWQHPAALAGAGAAAVLIGVAIYFLSAPSKPAVVQANRDDVTPANIKPPVPPVRKSSAPRAISPAPVAKVEVSPKLSRAPAAPSEPDFEILEAEWGAGENWANVTEGVRKRVINYRLMMIVWPGEFGSPADPAPGVAKNLRIRYRARGQVFTVEYPEFFFACLDGNPLAPPTDSPDGLEVLEARWGAGTAFFDVSAKARERVRDGRFSASADDFVVKDVVPDGYEANNWANAFKVLWMRYRNATGEHTAYSWNGDLLSIDVRLPQTAGPPVDLLKQIDVQRDAVQGDWKLDAGGLAAPGGMYDRLQLPGEAPEEYILTAVVEAEGELRDVSFGLPVGGRQVLCTIDGGKGLASGMNKVNDAWFIQADKNPTSPWRKVRLLEQGRPNTLTYIVRKSSVRVLRDGAQLVRWSGDPQSLSLSPNYVVPDPRKLFVQSYDMPFRVTKLELTPLAPAKSELILRPEPNAPIDVLAKIDLDRDALHGSWQFDGHSLITPQNSRGALQLPVVLPEEYRLEAIAARESGDDNLTFTVPIGGKQSNLIIDGYKGTLSGLQPIDGKSIDVNETRHEASLFADGQPKAISITVRKNGVQMVCDGRTLVDWTGDVSRLGRPDKLPYEDRAYLGDWYSRYRITKLEVTPLGGDSTPAPAPAVAGKAIDVLKQIDLKRDAQWGEWRLENSVLFAPATANSRLQSPVVPPEEYQLTLVAQGDPITRDIVMALPIAGRQVLLVLDGWSGTPSALLQLIDGKPKPNNETTVNHRVLADGETEIVCTVRKTSIEVKCNGKQVIHWSGDPAKLANDRDVPSVKHLYLYSWSTPYRVSKFEIAPLAAASVETRPPAGLLKLFEDEPQFAAALKTGEGSIEFDRETKFSGQGSLKVSGRQKYDEHLPGVEVKIRKQPQAPGEYRYLRFAWKKRGGEQILFQLHYPNNWFRYSAGPFEGDGFAPSVRVSNELPEDDFVVVTRDLAEDFGEFTFTGMALTPVDGECAWFDHIYMARELKDFDQLPAPRPPAVASAPASKRPRTLGDLLADYGPRSRPPDDADERKAFKEFQDSHGGEIAGAKSPDQKRKLAERLLQIAAETEDASAALYVLLLQASKLGEAAGDSDVAWQAIEALANRFEVDEIALRQQSLAEFAKTAKSPLEARNLTDAACQLLADALAAEQADAVKKIAAQAQSFAKRTKDAALVKAVGVRTREAGKRATEFAAVAAARKKLKSQPDDAEANFTIGRFEACAAGHWDIALARLALGSDSTWKSVAEDDLEGERNVSTAEQQISVGDRWWALAENEIWPGKFYMHVRAAQWYRRARPAAAEKDKARIDERLKTLLAEDDGLPVWELFDISPDQKRGGYVRLAERSGLRTPFEYEGPLDVTFVARTDSLNIRLFAHGHEAVIWNWEVNPMELRVTRPTGDAVGTKFTPLAENRWYEFHYVITPQGTTIAVDGEVVFDERNNYAAIPRSPVGVYGARGSVVDVKKFVVKPLK